MYKNKWVDVEILNVGCFVLFIQINPIKQLCAKKSGEFLFFAVLFVSACPTVCVTCGWVDVDKTPRARFCSGVDKA